MNTLKKININIKSMDLYEFNNEQMRMSYSVATKILEDTLDNFPNLTEFKADFLG